ncbi:MAG: thioredoxin reductase, partial [Actinomycetota bacterium]|nr:thioredoxin reductase [Actinomycetota bacterium]
MASAQAPSEVPLVVVGGGPTGIAALFEARREGIEAVGLEAGPGPTTSIREYLNGLVLISRPTDYEIAGIPLDTRDPNQLTREEVLHYLGRVINYGSLGLRFHAPALELVPQDGRVLVRT